MTYRCADLRRTRSRKLKHTRQMKRLDLTIIALLAMALPTAKAELDNDCALVATEAFAKVAPYACWARLLAFKFIDVAEGKTYGHVMFCWQATRNGRILIYDHNGTLFLKTHSTNIRDIVTEMNKNAAGHLIIIEALWLE